MAITNYGKSVHDRLLNIAKLRNLSYQTLVSRYIQERLLYRLSISRYREHFLLKGGALIYAISGLEARPTVDIDFLGEKISRDMVFLRKVFAEICSIKYDADGIYFDSSSIETEELMIAKEYNGVRIRIVAKLHSMRETVSMDIGFGDVVYPYANELDYPALLEENPIKLLAYSPETVVAEKFEAMIKLGLLNSRMKDFYDVYMLLTSKSLRMEELGNAISATFSNRNTPYIENHPLFTDTFKTDSSRNMRWKAYLKKIKSPHSLSFSEVVDRIIDELNPFWEAMKYPKY